MKQPRSFQKMGFDIALAFARGGGGGEGGVGAGRENLQSLKKMHLSLKRMTLALSMLRWATMKLPRIIQD